MKGSAGQATQQESMIFTTAGYSNTEVLKVWPTPYAKCGKITDGIVLQHDDEGAWVISFKDLEAIYRASRPAESEDAERKAFEEWVTAMEPAYANENLERLTGGRGNYRAHNVAMWWMAWLARSRKGVEGNG